MNKRIKKLWLKVLRSGKYKQREGKLKYNHKYCCLGVLCDLHAKETNGQWKPRINSEEYWGSTTSLPDEVLKWAKLPTKAVRITNSKYGSLIGANDDGRSFKQIANLIEHRL